MKMINPKDRYIRIVTTVLALICAATVLIILPDRLSRPSGTITQEAVQPAIFPDYKEVTIPANIAPLNFRIEIPVEQCYVEVTGSRNGSMEESGINKILFKRKEWQQLTEANKGAMLTFTVSTKQGGKWTTWQPFTIRVSEHAIDSHLAYRLIEPGYEKWHIIGIYQRDLESYSEKVIARNDLTDYNCINCHSFSAGNPQQMMLHMRAAHGGTYLAQNGKIEKLNTKTDGTFTNMTYPYWHPSGRYIAASVNDIKQIFHAVKDKKVEVIDLESDVVVYDVEKKEILSKASLIGKESFETFPSFSADGKWLYFCSAPATRMPDHFDEVRYSLCRIAFDPEKGEISYPIDTLVHADSLSASFPRISPDGRFLMYTEAAYGQFPIWHKEADIRMIDLNSGEQIDMSALNSADTDSYHSWSRNSRWVVVSSRRDNGLYTCPYFCFIGEDGTPAKPFLLPQEDPDHYDRRFYSYNIPELITGEVEAGPYAFEQAAKHQPATQVGFQ